MSGDPQLRDPAFAINEDERRGRGMSGRIEDQVKAEIASRRLHPDDGYSYEECNGPSCRAIRDAAARAAAPPVEPGAEGAYSLALIQIEHDGEVIKRLTQALHVATHAPHDQDGEPDNGFPVCSICGAIQTGPPDRVAGLREAITMSLRTIHGDIVPLPNRAPVEEYAEIIVRFLPVALVAEPVPGLRDRVKALRRGENSEFDNGYDAALNAVLHLLETPDA